MCPPKLLSLLKETMAKQENKNTIPTEDALREWLLKDMIDGPLSFSLVPQAAPNRHINCYRVETGEGVFFVKVYLDTPDVAEREVENYELFKTIPFAPALKYYIFPADSQKRLIAYEYIDGDDLHKQFTAARQQGIYLDSSIIGESIYQMAQMREIVKQNESLVPAKTPWPLKSPIRRDFIPKGTEEAFLADYTTVFGVNAEAIRLFPGYYFDRNPRNLMHDENGVHQVDFGVIENSSPIFDLVKLLRNGTDLILEGDIDLHAIDSSSPLIEKISTYPLQDEQEFLLRAYDEYMRRNVIQDGATFENFVRCYQYAAIHSHIFYMTKYLRMLKEDTGEKDKLTARCVYHIGLAKKTIEEMVTAGEPVGNMLPWINHFIEIATPTTKRQ